MARRHRIVHEADLPTANAVTDAPWTLGDDYQLVVWIFVVVAFASRLRTTLDPSQIAEQRIAIIEKLTDYNITVYPNMTSPWCFLGVPESTLPLK